MNLTGLYDLKNILTIAKELSIVSTIPLNNQFSVTFSSNVMRFRSKVFVIAM